MSLDNELTVAKQPDIRELTRQQLVSIFGDSGTQRYSGYFQEEFNQKWRDEARVDTVEEMRRADGTVKAILQALKAPILATEWFIEAEDEKMKEFIEDNLFNLKGGISQERRSWRDFLREALAYLDFGHYVFELIYEIREGKIFLKDLAPRIPRSIQDWKLSDGSFGITQNIRTDDDVRFTAEIPGEKLLVLTNDKEGDDVTGQSILRPSYIHWKMKNVLYRISAIAAERYGVGIPVIWMPAGVGQTDKDDAKEMVQQIRSNEKAFIAFTGSDEDWKIKILTPEGNPQGAQIDTLITHHDQMMLRSILAGFLGLGADSTGSFALSKDQSSFFLKHVEDKAHYVAEQITDQVIGRLVRLNFGDKAEVPRLRFTPLGDLDFAELSEVLDKLLNAGLIEPSPKIKEWTHKTFKLPELTEEEIDAMEEAKEEDELAALEQEEDDEEAMDALINAPEEEEPEEDEDDEENEEEGEPIIEPPE